MLEVGGLGLDIFSVINVVIDGLFEIYMYRYLSLI